MRTPPAAPNTPRWPDPRLVAVPVLAALAWFGGAAVAAEYVAPYVASPQEDVERLLSLADVGHGDYLIDLGSGDGRIVIAAALRGAMGHGVELDEALVALARRNARAAEVADRVAFRQGDLLEADLSHATVVTVYLMPDVNLRLRPRLLAELTPGTRLLSISFDMGDWQPDRHVAGRVSGGIMMWIVPARTHGGWYGTADGAPLELRIEQRFQHIEAQLLRSGEELYVLEAALEGSRIALLATDGQRRYAFSGRVAGGTMAGVVQIHEARETRIAEWEAGRESSSRR